MNIRLSFELPYNYLVSPDFSLFVASWSFKHLLIKISHEKKIDEAVTPRIIKNMAGHIGNISMGEYCSSIDEVLSFSNAATSIFLNTPDDRKRSKLKRKSKINYVDFGIDI